MAWCSWATQRPSGRPSVPTCGGGKLGSLKRRLRFRTPCRCAARGIRRRPCWCTQQRTSALCPRMAAARAPAASPGHASTLARAGAGMLCVGCWCACLPAHETTSYSDMCTASAGQSAEAACAPAHEHLVALAICIPCKAHAICLLVRRCHPDDPQHQARCEQPCTRPLACGHGCTRPCWQQPCPPCPIPVLVKLQCSHVVEAPCHASAPELQPACQTPVMAELECGHAVEAPCCKALGLQRSACVEKAEVRMPGCGHVISVGCGEAPQVGTACLHRPVSDHGATSITCRLYASCRWSRWSIRCWAPKLAPTG